VWSPRRSRRLAPLAKADTDWPSGLRIPEYRRLTPGKIAPDAFRMCRIVASEIEDRQPCSGLTIALAT
jgi:hypothetical protein